MTPAPEELVLCQVWSGSSPTFVVLEGDAGRWILGRDAPGGEDDRMSRRHCEVLYSDGCWQITDLGSANGTHVDRHPVQSQIRGPGWRVLQIGRSLFVPLRLPAGSPRTLRRVVDGFVGPGMWRAWEATGGAAARGRPVVLVGSAGCGVQPLMDHYVECLDVDGQTTIVQLESKTPASAVGHYPAGALFAVGLDGRPWVANHPWIRAALQRRDLRLCVPFESDTGRMPVSFDELAALFDVICVPSIEARPEEIPWWIAQAAAEVDPDKVVDVTFVEDFLLRAWPWGLPYLVEAVRSAARNLPALTVKELPRHRPGQRRILAKDEPLPSSLTARRAMSDLRERGAFEAVYRECGGDPVKIAERLGVGVDAVDGWIRRQGLDGGS